MPPPPAALKKKSSKNVPIFSQEYFIQNHGDIACIVVMVLTIGTIIHATSPYFGIFFGPRHNVTSFEGSTPASPQLFTYGSKDLAMFFAYSLICIIIHAMWQEYVLDKLYKKLHLSKSKNSKFFESGQLVLFYIISVIWAIKIFIDENYFHSGLGYLWTDYPYTGMTVWTKLFFIIQISYWLHNYPELYLQKVRKEDMRMRIVYTSLYLITILYGYITRFWRISIVLLTINYLIEICYHSSRLAYFYSTTITNSKTAKSTASYLFKTWNCVFIIGRLLSIVLAWLTFWFGLRGSSISKISFTPSSLKISNDDSNTVTEPIVVANFNTATVRLFTLVVIGALQFWLVWNFIQFHLKRRRSEHSVRSSTITSPKTSNKQKQKQQDTSNGKADNEETNERPVVAATGPSNKKSN